MRWSMMLAAAAGLVGARSQAQGVLVPGPGPLPRDVGPGMGITRIVRTASAVQATLTDQVLHYEVDETFTNRGGGLGEVDYYFPLPPNAAFEDLKLSINGEMVSGEVMNANQARAIYEDIVRRRRDPALVEWMGQGLLHARIFPIGPGEEKRVVVRFQSVVSREGDAVRVDYKRPAPVPYSVRQQAAAYDTDGESSFTLRYPAGAGYGAPYSPTHSLVVRTSGDMRTVGVDGAGRDITILLPVARTKEPAISVLTNAPSDERGYALITIAPPAVLPQSLPRDVTFVVDVSGSMSGRKIAQARDAGKALLATLGPRDRFRLIDFDTDVRTFRDAFSDATPANIEAADRYLDALEAHGSTNIEGALRAALGTARDTDGADDGGRVQLVLFLTDGEPTVGERDPKTLSALASSMRGARHVFTFGLGADVNASLLEQVALQGHGTSSFVRPDEDLERSVSVVASRLRDPVLADVHVEAKGIALSSVMPAMIPDLFAGQSIVLLARYQGSGHATIRVSGRTAHGPASWAHELDFPARSRDNSFIPRLWATQRVGWLTAERRAQGPSPEVDDEIKSLGERYGIPTELTSYLVREPMTVGLPTPASPQPVGSAGVRARASASPREMGFEAAKQATAMRASSSLAAADSVSDAYAAASPRSATVRRVANRMFERQSDTSAWMDRGYRAGMARIRIQAYSAAYFELVETLPELRAVFALGDNVVVAGRNLAIEVTTDAGAATALDAADRTAIRENW